jgi:hypothetical protein
VALTINGGSAAEGAACTTGIMDIKRLVRHSINRARIQPQHYRIVFVFGSLGEQHVTIPCSIVAESNAKYLKFEISRGGILFVPPRWQSGPNRGAKHALDRVSQFAELFLFNPQKRRAMFCSGTQSKEALASRAGGLGCQR